jgi:Replication-relaxation
MSTAHRSTPRVAKPAPLGQAGGGLSAESANDSVRAGLRQLRPARYLTADRLAALDAGLSDRERSVIQTVRTLRVMSGAQLQRWHFTDARPRERQRVMARLVARRLVAQLPRQVGGVRRGSAGAVFALDVAGQRLTDGTGPAHGYKVQRPWLPGPATLAHALGIAEVVTRLVEGERAGLVRLVAYETEPHCWRHFLGRGGGRETVKPDAYLHLGIDGYADHWFIEYDRGTQSPRTLGRKAEQYRRYWATGRELHRLGVHPRTLFVVEDPARHAVVVDTLSRQPAEAWPLFAVTTLADVVARLRQGAAT